MGYKLARCEVLGDLEIDPKMNKLYVKNHHPKYNYLMDIREFNKIPDEEIPEELKHLDILDGSPPCTTFSMAGKREDSWGKKKKFREGQAEQTLDDLSFVFIETAKKLKPKVVIMENVEGLLLGEAFTYVQRIYKEFAEGGYKVKHWLCKGENMGIPQRRHRVFFVATRLDFDINKINMVFDYEPITYGEIKEGNLTPLKEGSLSWDICKNATDKDSSIADTRVRLGQKGGAFQTYYIRDNEILPTLRSKPNIIDINKIGWVSWQTLRNSQTFPSDYDYIKFGRDNVGYVCGMSVPPVMMKRIVTRVIESGIFEVRE
ncbi:DNA cytosine methyltransferase [Candidatus Saccharibacteria bacterium]|nr:DNA cytosine methyltransferase [Candidatus Saccharibacteria bacterium]